MKTALVVFASVVGVLQAQSDPTRPPPPPKAFQRSTAARHRHRPTGPICPKELNFEDIIYWLAGEGPTQCFGPLSDCIYQHGWICYCLDSNYNLRPTPCPRTSDYSKTKTNGNGNSDYYQTTTLGYGTSNNFSDFDDGAVEIYKITLYPAVATYLDSHGNDIKTLVCGGVDVTYNSATKSHGQVSQTVPNFPPVTIDLYQRPTTFITGAFGRTGSIINQITLATSTESASGSTSPHEAHPCGGIFGGPQAANPHPTSPNSLCYLYSLAGSTVPGIQNVLTRIDFIWKCVDFQ